MPDSPPSRPPLLRTDSPPSAPEPDSPSSAYRHGSRGAHAQGPEGDHNTHRSPRTPGPSPRSVLRIDASGLYIFPSKDQPASPRRHQRRLSRAGSLGSQNSLVSIDEESALTPAAVKKALQGQQQGSAGVWNKRRCAALVCVAVWTYAIIYFAALYSYRPSRVKINQ